MRRISVGLLALLTVGLLGAASWLQVQMPLVLAAADPSDAAVREVVMQPVLQHEHITLWEPLVSDKYDPYENIALIANVFVALAGLGLRLDARGPGEEAPTKGRRGCRKLPGPIREGAERLSVPAVPRRGRADRLDHRLPCISRPQ